MVHGAEKSIKDLGDNADLEIKKEVEASIAEIKTALEGEDISVIKEKTANLSASMMKIGEAAYKANAPETENTEEKDNSSSNKKQEDVVDADFEEVKSDEEKKSDT